MILRSSKPFNRPSAFLAGICIFLVALSWTCVSSAAQGTVRHYYIAAEDTLWDFAPSYPDNPMMGRPFNNSERIFVGGNGRDRIGHRYKKALYREYTDASFSSYKTRPQEWEHLGILGPVIRASVGDTIKVIFKNNTVDKTLTMHPHGLSYDKASEGSPYNDGTSGKDKLDDGVRPGETYTYTWDVPESAGPGPDDPDSIVWLYHSHTDEPADTNAGLIGTLIISRKDRAWPDGRPKDVDREFVTLFKIFDENASLYLRENMAAFAPEAEMDDEDFIESNLMHSMNGYVYDNLPGLVINQGEKVRWYVVALGTEVDLHSAHWHGNTVLSSGQRTDVIELMPASMKTVTMIADNPGEWMFHCHVDDHIKAGMMGRYIIRPGKTNH